MQTELSLKETERKRKIKPKKKMEKKGLEQKAVKLAIEKQLSIKLNSGSPNASTKKVGW